MAFERLIRQFGKVLRLLVEVITGTHAYTHGVGSFIGAVECPVGKVLELCSHTEFQVTGYEIIHVKPRTKIEQEGRTYQLVIHVIHRIIGVTAISQTILQRIIHTEIADIEHPAVESSVKSHDSSHARRVVYMARFFKHPH